MLNFKEVENYLIPPKRYFYVPLRDVLNMEDIPANEFLLVETVKKMWNNITDGAGFPLPNASNYVVFATYEGNNCTYELIDDIWLKFTIKPNTLFDNK